MSRIGKKPIIIPNNVKVEIKDNIISIKGPKGNLKKNIPQRIDVNINNGILNVQRGDNSKESRALHGLTRAIISNMITGVTEGFSKSLEIQGLGYRALMEGKKLKLYLGFSHPVEIEPYPDIKIDVQRSSIIITGMDKEKVGTTADTIRRLKPPEPYKAKGIRYTDEVIKKKVGKAAG